jgi:hypothetical protein
MSTTAGGALQREHPGKRSASTPRTPRGEGATASISLKPLVVMFNLRIYASGTEDAACLYSARGLGLKRSNACVVMVISAARCRWLLLVSQVCASRGLDDLASGLKTCFISIRQQQSLGRQALLSGTSACWVSCLFTYNTPTCVFKPDAMPLYSATMPALLP